MASNRAPQCNWHSTMLACGTRRQRLYVNGLETPYFVDTAAVHAHKTMGEKHGLFGAGMSEPNAFGQRHAAILGCGKSVALLKHRAEQFATN